MTGMLQRLLAFLKKITGRLGLPTVIVAVCFLGFLSLEIADYRRAAPQTGLPLKSIELTCSDVENGAFCHGLRIKRITRGSVPGLDGPPIITVRFLGTRTCRGPNDEITFNFSYAARGFPRQILLEYPEIDAGIRPDIPRFGAEPTIPMAMILVMENGQTYDRSTAGELEHLDALFGGVGDLASTVYDYLFNDYVPVSMSASACESFLRDDDA